MGLLGACAALLASGCGGGTEQNHGEVKRSYDMRIVSASFPAKQSIARQTSMSVNVRNDSNHVVPDVAITVDSFSYVEKFAELASNKRPIWSLYPSCK